MSDSLLTSQQLQVICALSSGATVTNAAAEAGIHRNTITNWRRNEPAFQEALGHAHYDRALLFREKMEALVPLAVHILKDLLVNPETPATVRLKAALTILQTATTPPEPKISSLEVHNPAQSEPDPQPEPEKAVDAVPVHPCSLVAQDPQPVHNPAQKKHTKIGRNEPCPCGSGQKYKRCCLNKPQTQTAAQPPKTVDPIRVDSCSLVANE